MKKALAIVILAGPGRATRCTVPGRDKCAAPPTNRLQYVYAFTRASYGACPVHANRHEYHAPQGAAIAADAADGQ